MMTSNADDKVVISLKDVEACRVASIKGTGTYEEIGKVLMDLFRWVLERRAKVVSYPMIIYPEGIEDLHTGGGEFEACIPIDQEMKIAGAGSVKIKDIPAVSVAFAKHMGAVSEVEAVHDQILEWVEENGYRVTGPSRELFLTNPMEVSEEELLTEIQIPVEAVRH
jgi:effector-binding domain-containing protein